MNYYIDRKEMIDRNTIGGQKDREKERKSNHT